SYIGSGLGNTGTVVMSGGTLNVGLVATPGVRADFEVGSFNGSGTMTQTGGDVVLNTTGGFFHIGNQGTGVYNLEAGSITTLNAFALGRSTAAGVGNGTLNISGGSLTLATPSKSAFLIGGVDGGHSARGGGNGVVNQTGGVVSVAHYMELGTRGGHGAYNLDGGVLRIGGAGALRADTNGYDDTGDNVDDVTGTYEFNLGGGTLQVMGSNLTSAVAMTLKSGTTSTIDTNGLGATFSGALSGMGALTKVGDGTLTFSGASTFSGGTLVSDGTLIVNGSLANSTVSVGAGATLGGHGSVAGVNVLDDGRLELGGAPGTFTITGDLTLAGASRTLLYLAAGSNDHLAVGGTLFAGGVLEVGLAGDFDLLEGASFDLFDGTLSRDFTNVLLPTLGSGLEWSLVDFSSGVILVVTASAIPEPSTWTAILGGVVLAIAAWRRRYSQALETRRSE
ncbi:MAG TPA: autotransporter-associated beta strand repeat-containing protein, partial [Opitutus sp.]|nr:autotransporter-associated beta strand repeat-containing protein [Opitutus sp.]